MDPRQFTREESRQPPRRSHAADASARRAARLFVLICFGDGELAWALLAQEALVGEVGTNFRMRGRSQSPAPSLLRGGIEA